jgi:DNA invertase Pin-like site-specific DNA recombinase
MRAIAYTRVSTRQQGESGLGLDAQREACATWASTNDCELAELHIDAGVSGTAAIDKRPGLVAALAALRRGYILVVAKRDRLGRDPVVGAMIERMVERKGARIVSAAGEGTDGDGPTSVLMRRIVDAFAEYERLIIGARTRAALGAKRERGEKTGGAVPLGYVLADDGVHLERDTHEARAVDIILSMRAEGMSIRAIAERLNADDVPARGAKWHPTSVARVLKRFGHGPSL